ncbi:MAG: hypothetical protein KJ718_06350 [Nanoarchaeota archaeon]|nr:hypothetical protein [Nanoarchaeota archaeon]MBU1052138.1 hypothetical protein [Nanoarchaeota archaeon]MBU1987856.1 hypothetical protein [Nanoarchaeota archaeon]
MTGTDEGPRSLNSQDPEPLNGSQIRTGHRKRSAWKAGVIAAALVTAGAIWYATRGDLHDKDPASLQKYESQHSNYQFDYITDTQPNKP